MQQHIPKATLAVLLTTLCGQATVLAQCTDGESSHDVCIAPTLRGGICALATKQTCRAPHHLATVCSSERLDLSTCSESQAKTNVFASPTVLEKREQGRDTVWNGVGYGALAGGLAGIIPGAVLSPLGGLSCWEKSDCDSTGAKIAVFGTVVASTALVGSLIGLIVDAAN